MTSSELETTPAVERGRRALDKAAAALKGRAATVQTQAGDLAEQARVYADRAAGQLNTYGRAAVERARERPATSALAILGLGVALGAALALTLRRPAEGLAASALDEATRLKRRLRG